MNVCLQVQSSEWKNEWFISLGTSIKKYGLLISYITVIITQVTFKFTSILMLFLIIGSSLKVDEGT